MCEVARTALNACCILCMHGGGFVCVLRCREVWCDPRWTLDVGASCLCGHGLCYGPFFGGLRVLDYMPAHLFLCLHISFEALY